MAASLLAAADRPRDKGCSPGDGPDGRLLSFEVMDATQDRRARQRRASWALFLALLPMLTFMGHWPQMVSIPGTELYLWVPLAGHQAEVEHEGGHHDHSKHCHGDAASCTDAPAAAGVAIALMGGIVTLPGAHTLLLLGLIAGALPLAALSVSPELRPPRLALVRRGRMAA